VAVLLETWLIQKEEKRIRKRINIQDFEKSFVLKNYKKEKIRLII
jgi:hypothetical protein